jgi:GrpB-like predicted nucleotidyltransferase (UPF0157 family)
MRSELTGSSSIGLTKGVVALLPYTLAWKRLFEEEQAILQANLGNHILEIQHIGSTSIPGMVAKPIIDIAIAVRDFEGAKVCIDPIEHLGYQYRGEFGIPRRHYFVKGDPRTHHIHMLEITSQDWKNQLFFRDYLTRHPQSARDYANLKIEMAQRFPKDRESYLEAKAPFIQSVLQLARSEREIP